MLSKAKTRRRLRRHGFMKRTLQGGGVLKSRRAKGRKRLSVSRHSK